MDINTYVELFFEKMKEVGYYSELPENELNQVIYQYLNDIYESYIEIIQLKADIQLMTEKEYKAEMDGLKIKMYNAVSDLMLSSIN